MIFEDDKQIRKQVSDKNTSSEETAVVLFENLEDGEIVARPENANEDVTDDISNTFFTDSVLTTPYYSPDEDFDNIFDSNPKLDESIDINSKMNIKENTSVPRISSAKIKDEISVNEKEILKPANNSFTVVKHKKVELSPTTFQSHKTCVEGKGKSLLLVKFMVMF